MKFKAFIFDMDGTLVDSIQDLADAVNYSMEKQGFGTLSLEEIRVRIGHGIDRLVIDSLPEKYRDNKKIVARSLEYMARFYSQNWRNNTKLYPNVDKLLDKLAIAGIPCAIVSNKPQPFLEEMVEFLLGKWDWVDVCGGKEGVPLKPNPQSTTDVLKKFGTNDAAFVGDGDTDIKTAIAAGITPIAAHWGFRTHDELEQAGAAIFIDGALDLLDFI